MQPSGTSSSFAAVHEGAILQRMPLVQHAQPLVNGPASWEQTLDRAAKRNNPKLAQVAQRTSTSEKGTASQAAFINLFRLSPT